MKSEPSRHITKNLLLALLFITPIVLLMIVSVSVPDFPSFGFIFLFPGAIISILTGLSNAHVTDPVPAVTISALFYWIFAYLIVSSIRRRRQQ